MQHAIDLRIEVQSYWMESCILAFDCVKIKTYWPVGSNTDLFWSKLVKLVMGSGVIQLCYEVETQISIAAF